MWFICWQNKIDFREAGCRGLSPWFYVLGRHLAGMPPSLTDLNEASLLSLIEKIRRETKIMPHAKKLIIRRDVILELGDGDWDAGCAVIEKMMGQKLEPR